MGLVGGGYALGSAPRDSTNGYGDPVPFFGRHQAGISTQPPEHVALAAFDFEAEDASSLRELLIEWTAVAASLTAGEPADRDLLDGTPDPGEAADLAPASLTVTLGLGPTLFRHDGTDRLGLAHLQPAPLTPLPYFRGDVLDPKRSGGDLCVQACADNSQVAFHAIHVLMRAALGTASLRWLQSGFRGAASPSQRDPRNLMGFKDGTANVDASSNAAMRRSVWIGERESPGWMRHGTYLVARRVRMLLDSWDALSQEGQERAVGRHKSGGEPLGATSKRQRPDLNARRNGELVIPSDAHVRLASRAAGDGPPPLRRSYSFSDGIDASTGQLDAGLLFISFQRDPLEQFAPIQRRLAENDALSAHLQHTASAVFACLPGTRPGGYLGETLFANL